MTQQATGFGIHELVADVIVNNGRVHEDLFRKNYRYTLKKFAYEVILNNMKKGHTGVLTKPIDAEGEVANMRSTTALFPSVNVGDVLKVTRDLATAPGCLMMMHSNLDIIHTDLDRLRELEA